MLSEHEIQQALRASRVVPVAIANPHGPFGWEQVAQILARFLERAEGRTTKIMHSLEIPAETWQKLEQLADEATRSASRPVSVAEVAAAILQHYAAHER